MIIFDAPKAVLLLNPKTGTRSVVDYFHRVQFHGGKVRIAARGHVPYRAVHSQFGEGGDGYEFFSFYRCPIERFISVCNYVVGEWDLLWGNYPLSPETMAKAKAEIQELTPEDLLNSLAHSDRGPVLDVARLQTEFLTPEVQLLDFRDFDSELIRLTTSLGVDALPEVLCLNKSSPKFRADDLSPELIERIKQHYAADYEFFASRGITFNR
jgi:hypothetical protein